MSRIAVIGSGISGLAASYYLSRKHTVFLFEREGRLGGHTHTVTVSSSRGPLPVDTGFIVHNDRTYPNLVQLLAEIGIETQMSDMSFAVSCRKTGFEYSSRGLRGFFAQRSNLFRSRHYRLFWEIVRFNRRASEVLGREDATETTMGDFLAEGRYSREFIGYYLLPMASAVWSTSPEKMKLFPAQTLIRFFDNHGMLGLTTHPKWKVLRGGSSTYIPKLVAPLGDRIHTRARITSVKRSETAVSLEFSDRPAMQFDQVVFACHGDEVLPLLALPTPREREIFENFRTSRNEVCLHTDSALLPARPDARASWNYNLNLAGADAATVTYHMNRLQGLGVTEDYCVTLNGTGAIDPAKILVSLTYNHPLYTREAIRAQSHWAEISGSNRTHYCGAYWFYGFHEDGLNSALRVARAMGIDC
ncbi:MAG: FAD-dependent oxidoreductase [Acidobacteria bacterium]|nr:FAD-dependent oxidoreductase [Acidobacteriota bacterium]